MITPHFTSLPPLSLYIHIPWCVRKCPYCDFNSHTCDALPETHYVNALLADLDQELVHVQGRRLQSIFFGGGTPSLFAAQAIEAILSGVEKRIAFADDIEITLEANPGTVEQKKFSAYRQAGVNRLSIGVQSFNTDHLKHLGRIHDSHAAITAVTSARKAGFDNVNVDLMHGLPEQSLEQAIADLQQAIALSPSHISWYQLTIEPNTVFYNTKPVLPSDDKRADIQAVGEQLLQQRQFLQYEVSAYCLTGKHSRHNLNYWLFGDYIGIGAGAHGKITMLDQQLIKRTWKTRMPEHYLKTDTAFKAGEKFIEPCELPLEFMMNALRLNEGAALEDFYRNTGLPFAAIEHAITDLVSQGLMEPSANRVKPSATGKQFLNDVLLAF